MRTCPNCGCYVPDRWITCPACEARVKVSKEALAPVFSKKKTEWDPWKDGTRYTEEKLYEDSFSKCYRVKVYYKDGTMIDTIYGVYENALKHAQYTMDKFWYCVQFIEVWDCQRKARLGVFYPNS